MLEGLRQLDRRSFFFALQCYTNHKDVCMEHRNITTIKQAYEHKKGDRLWQDNREKAIDFRLLICNRKKLKKTGAATGKRREKSQFFRKKVKAKFVLSDYNKAIKTKRKTEKETSFRYSQQQRTDTKRGIYDDCCYDTFTDDSPMCRHDSGTHGRPIVLY